MRRFLFAPRFSLVTMMGAAVLTMGISFGSIASILAGACIVLVGAHRHR